MAARRIRRRRSGRGASVGRRPGFGVEETAGRAEHSHHHRPRRTGTDLGAPRVRTRGDGARRRRPAHVARMGRLVGPRGSARQLPAPAARSLREVRVQGGSVRTFRPGLRPLPHRFRPHDARRDRQIPRVHGSGRGSRRPARRLALGRARRWPGARRTAAAHVQRRDAAGVPRVQVDMGPGLADESGQDHRRQSARRRSAAGASYQAPSLPTWFSFTGDGRSFGRATTRCVGVGKCRKTDSGTMCPSYMVTLEEKHSTRGRARLLFEMLQGDPLEGGWQNEDVKEALDVCLACKGCKQECPVSVDMATYKAEFLAHYFEGRRRPVSAFAFGSIDRWAALAELAPRLVNLATQTPALRELAKIAAGMPLERRIPAFAPRTFRDSFSPGQPPRHTIGPASSSGRTRSTIISILRPRSPRSTSSRRWGLGWRSRCETLLRPAALRLRAAAGGTRAPAADHGRSRRRDRRGCPDRGTGTELRRRVPR